VTLGESSRGNLKNIKKLNFMKNILSFKTDASLIMQGTLITFGNDMTLGDVKNVFLVN